MASGIHRTRLKRWIVPVTALILLLIAAVLWLWIPWFLKSTLTGYTGTKTNGSYVLEIEHVGRSLFPLSVTLQGVNLEPDERAAVQGPFKSDNLLYRFKAGELRFEGLDILKLITSECLSGEKIKIVKPEVRLSGEELVQMDSLSASHEFIQNLWPLFGRITSIEIGKIELEDANFGFYSTKEDSGIMTRAEKVAIDIHRFTASKEMAEAGNRLFNTEDVILRMNDFSIDMGDNLHEITIDTLLYSLKTTDIRVNGFRLLPFDMNPDENLFEIHVPQVYVKSRSITHFALKDSLEISFLNFKNPEIKFFRKNNPKQLDIPSIDKFDLYSLLQQKFSKLEVDSFLLESAIVEIYKQPDTVNYKQQFSTVDVVLHGFLLDSSAHRNENKILYADNLEMQVRGYHLKLEDNAHHFRAGSMFVSTFSSQLSAHDVQVYPENPLQGNLKNEINIACDALEFEKVDFLSLYHERILPASMIAVIEPEVHLKHNLQNNTIRPPRDTGLLFDLVTDYLQGAYADTVRMTRGRLDIRNSFNDEVRGYVEASIDFRLNDFSLDSASVQESSNFFYASGFDLQFTDYNMRLNDDLHSLEVDSLTISSYSDEVEIRNIKIQPVIDEITPEIMKNTGYSELFRIRIPKVLVKSINLRDALFGQTVHIADFTITGPEIYFENYRQFRQNTDKKEVADLYKLIFSYLDDIDIRHFRIDEGILTWINHTRRGRTTRFDNAFSAALHNFRLNEKELSRKRLLFSDNFDLTIKDQEFKLSDNVHVLKGSNIRFSSADSSIKVEDALLFPRITSDKYSGIPVTWQVAIPEIKIEGFDFHKAYFSQEPELKHLELIKPRFQVYIQPNKTKGLELKSYRIPMPSFLESVKIAEFNINGGEAITYRREGIQHQAMANFYFNLRVPGLKLENNEQEQLSMISNNISLTLSDFRVPVDEVHNLQIGTIHFDRERKSIDVADLELAPYLSESSANRFSVVAPAIHFQDFDFNAALEENNFIFNRILASEPVIEITVNKEQEGESSEFLETLDLYPVVEHLVNSIQIGSLDIKNAHLNLNRYRKQLLSNTINLSFKDILVSGDQPAQQMLNSRAYSISTGNLSALSKNKLYAYTADSLNYYSDGSKVTLTNLALKPLTEKRNFPMKKGFQTDVLEAGIDYIELCGIDKKKWLQENILDARTLVIGPSHADIFRDKRFPFNKDQKPGWFQDLIKEINQPFIIDSIMLKPSEVVYNELLPIFDDPGYITFTDLTLYSNRLTNIPDTESNAAPFKIHARALLQNQAMINAHFTFDLSSTNYSHSVKGSLSPLPLASLNTMIMKSAPLKVESGQLNQLDFNITFNEDSAKGHLVVAYDNLKIAVLDYSGEKIEKDGLTTFLANNLKIKSQQPVKENSEPTEINYSRDDRRSIVNFWWKSLYSGVRKAIGI